MRLNKFLATCGVASRRKCDELILQNNVKVNGKIVSTLGVNINEKKDVIEFQGKVMSLPSEYVYIKLNKPKGYICSSKDDRKRKTVLDLVKIPGVRLFSVGRLDYDTEGLLILTNDGNFAEHLIHPSFELEKEYHVTIEGTVKESELAVLRKGVVIDGKRMPTSKVKLLGVTKTTNGIRTKISVIIHEGINRQVRKMFEAIGKNIILLKRVAIGQIKLGGLSRGEYKELTKKEMSCIDFSI